MTTAELYRKHKKGEVGRDKFIYEVRRDSNLPWITNITSYDDAIKILYNKGIISEALVKEGGYTDPDDEMFTMHLVDTIEGGNWDLTPEQLQAAVDYAEEHYYDLQGDFANTHSVDGGTYAAAKYVVNKIKSGDVNENIGNAEHEPFAGFYEKAIESASGDKISHTEEDDYGRTIYWSTKNPNVTYYIGDNHKIIKYDGKTGKSSAIGDINDYDEPIDKVYEEWGSPYDGGQDDLDAMARDANRQPSKTKTITSAELIDIANKAGQIVIDAEHDLIHNLATYGDRISMDAVNAILRNYDISLEDLDDIEVKRDRDLSIGDLYDRGYLQENKADDMFRVLDRLNPYAVKKALQFELDKKPIDNDDDYFALLKKISKKLQKDPLAYEFTQLANAKKIEKADAKLKMQPVKKDNVVDKPNEMKVIAKDAKANTKSSKKENKKGNPQGVKIMKEAVLAELTNSLKKKVKLAEDNSPMKPKEFHEYSVGMDVDTPHGHGNVCEVSNGTITVQFEDGTKKDYQMNYLSHIKNNGMGLDHYKDVLDGFSFEEKQDSDIKALKAMYEKLSDEDKNEARKSFITKLSKQEGKEEEVKKLHGEVDFDGFGAVEAKKDRVKQISHALKELLFKKKKATATATPTSTADNKPISLNPSNMDDKAIMQDPDFRKKYQPA